MKKILVSIFLMLVGSSLFAAPAQKTIVRLPAYPNSGAIEVDPRRFDQIYAISDVHGMYYNLRNLLLARHIIGFEPNGSIKWLAKKTLLVVVGDSVDKGPYSLNVLELFREISEAANRNDEGGAVVHLLGNHEAEFLNDPFNSKTSAFQEELRRKGVSPVRLVNPASPAALPLAKFIRQMPLALRVGSYIFCHSGLYPQMRWPSFVAYAENLLTYAMYSNSFITGPNSILEAKDWWKKPEERLKLESALTLNHIYGVVFGHQPKAFGVENDVAGSDQLRLIKIDSGMSPAKEEGGGYLGHMLWIPNAKQLLNMGPPEAYSVSMSSERRLSTQ